MAASVRTTTISPRAAPTAGVYDSADIVVASGDGIFVDIWYSYEWGTADALSSLVWDAPTANETITVLQSQTMTANSRFATAYLPSPTAKTGKIRATFAGTVNDACWMRVRHVIGHDTGAAAVGSSSRQETDIVANDLPITIAAAAGELVLYSNFVRNHPAYLDNGDLNNYQETQIGTSDLASVAGDKPGAASVSFLVGYTETSHFYNAIAAARVAAGAAPAPVITGPSGKQMTGGFFDLSGGTN